MPRAPPRIDEAQEEDDDDDFRERYFCRMPRRRILVRMRGQPRFRIAA